LSDNIILFIPFNINLTDFEADNRYCSRDNPERLITHSQNKR